MGCILVRTQWQCIEIGSSSSKKRWILLCQGFTMGLEYFCKEANSKYFSLCEHHTVAVLPTQLCHCSVKAAVDKYPDNGWVPINSTK